MTDKKDTARVTMLWPTELKGEVRELVGDRALTAFTVEAVKAKLAGATNEEVVRKDLESAERERDEARRVAQDLADAIVSGPSAPGYEFDREGALRGAMLPAWIDTTGWPSELAKLVTGASAATEPEPVPEPDDHDRQNDDDDDENLHKPMFLTGKKDPEKPDHPFEPGHSGMTCVTMVMRDGSGDQCGLPASAHKRAEEIPSETPPVTPVDLPHDRQPDDFLARVLAKAQEKGVDLDDAKLKPASTLPSPGPKSEPEPKVLATQGDGSAVDRLMGHFGVEYDQLVVEETASEPAVELEVEPEEPTPIATPIANPNSCPSCGDELINGECWSCF